MHTLKSTVLYWLFRQYDKLFVKIILITNRSSSQSFNIPIWKQWNRENKSTWAAEQVTLTSFFGFKKTAAFLWAKEKHNSEKKIEIVKY